MPEDARWILTDGVSVPFENPLPDGTQSDHILGDRRGRPMVALKATRASTDPIAAQDQGRRYAGQFSVFFVFSSNGQEVRFPDRENEAHARKIAGFYTQDDLGQRIAVCQVRRELSGIFIDPKMVDREYRIECIEALSTGCSRTAQAAR